MQTLIQSPSRSDEQKVIDSKGIWLIKKSKTENGGTQIQGKDDNLVIQHVLSGQYLASSDDGYALLSNELWEPAVIWSLQPYSGSEDGSGGMAHGDVAWIRQDSKVGKDEVAGGEVIWLSDISAESDHGCLQVNIATSTCETRCAREPSHEFLTGLFVLGEFCREC